MSLSVSLHQLNSVQVTELSNNSIAVELKENANDYDGVTIFLSNIDELVKLAKALSAGTYGELHTIKEAK